MRPQTLSIAALALIIVTLLDILGGLESKTLPLRPLAGGSEPGIGGAGMGLPDVAAEE